jgi:hypothetical protein
MPTMNVPAFVLRKFATSSAAVVSNRAAIQRNSGPKPVDGDDEQRPQHVAEVAHESEHGRDRPADPRVVAARARDRRGEHREHERGRQGQQQRDRHRQVHVRAEVEGGREPEQQVQRERGTRVRQVVDGRAERPHLADQPRRVPGEDLLLAL